MYRYDSLKELESIETNAGRQRKNPIFLLCVYEALSGEKGDVGMGLWQCIYG
jgi:hypothetical protein